MQIHKIHFQIAASCVISVYCSSPVENEQLYVLIDRALSSSGLISSHKDGVLGKFVLLHFSGRITVFTHIREESTQSAILDFCTFVFSVCAP